jgi:hemerythrin-like metal-binding protein
MVWLKWLDTFSVGHEELDRQHNETLELINKLYEFDEVKAEAEVFGTLLDKMIAGIRIHSVTEQIYMKEIGYNNIEKHMHEHSILLDKVLRIKKIYTEEGIEHAKTLISLISRELLDHMQEEKIFMAKNRENIEIDQS